jgi:hypothetical protein
MGVIQFIENMDRTTLTITDDEFEKNVEAAVSAIAEKHRPRSPPAQTEELSEKTSSTLRPPAGEPSSRRSFESSAGDTSTPRRSTDGGTDSGAEEQAAITGLLRTIQKPLSTIGRIFSDEPAVVASASPSSAPRTPAPNPSPRPSTDGPGDGSPQVQGQGQGQGQDEDQPRRAQLSAEEAAARQASAETAEAQRLHRAEHANIVETLAGMFPDLDRDIISDVVYQKQGR